jgi:hypothetical protein
MLVHLRSNLGEHNATLAMTHRAANRDETGEAEEIIRSRALAMVVPPALTSFSPSTPTRLPDTSQTSLPSYFHPDRTNKFFRGTNAGTGTTAKQLPTGALA